MFSLKKTKGVTVLREIGDIIGGYKVIRVEQPDELGRFIVKLEDPRVLIPMEPGSEEADKVVQDYIGKMEAQRGARQRKSKSKNADGGLDDSGLETTEDLDE